MSTDRINFLLDLHTTTANMGLTLLLDRDSPFNLGLAAYLISRNPQVKVLQSESSREKNRLRNICDLGLTLEVGAVAQGILDATLFHQTENLVFDILDYLEKYNQGEEIDRPEEIEIYSHWQTINYPRNDRGEIIAMIHPHLHHRDYHSLKKGEPMFVKFDGTEILYQGRSPVYPVFINESAYWEKNIAMSLTTKKKMRIVVEK
ncbi:MAG: aspartoacylase [Cyanobacteriota bacterium]|nr:aspartoacylase [Cyanobacteriota bacterium]